MLLLSIITAWDTRNKEDNFNFAFTEAIDGAGFYRRRNSSKIAAIAVVRNIIQNVELEMELPGSSTS